jgi:lycopene beta-cyclase
MLARFLFFAAEPERRVDVFERFYGLGQGLIERFYAARSPIRDRLRVLWGKPPVSIARALAAIFREGEPLKSQRGNAGEAAVIPDAKPGAEPDAKPALKTEKTA